MKRSLIFPVMVAALSMFLTGCSIMGELGAGIRITGTGGIDAQCGTRVATFFLGNVSYQHFATVEIIHVVNNYDGSQRSDFWETIVFGPYGSGYDTVARDYPMGDEFQFVVYQSDSGGSHTGVRAYGAQTLRIPAGCPLQTGPDGRPYHHVITFAP